MKFKTMTILACGLLFVSCGSKSEEKTTDQETTVEETTTVPDTAAIAEPISEETTEPVAEEKVSTEKWDALLDEYEEYLDKTIAFSKKAKAGDMSAMTEYASLIESAQSVQKKLEDAKNEMTPAQAARFAKIASKFASAAAAL